ncbi:aminoglycoside 3'-phosphotransferase [Curtobacterium sp. MCPF17_046]|uniref:aminoglycoside 3'-phosphotransferase n=1 Tax=Curtobacterium sp. MCPF17_046 TaxID=2175663 RepID=UPI000D9F9257|nr:aminoglycoside 3'-phosphotransferase [Curtobacterium sp. MCPF17_046]PYY39136.1 aminoglycoside 3'-phosphotransferase [Curtobacterium sp. MCPF17_046]
MPGVGDDGEPTDDLVGRGGLPDGPVEVPAAVVGVARGRPLEPVWVNSAGGRTFRLGPTPDRAEGYVKWVPPRYAPWIDAEVARLRWAARWLTVPEVLEHGADDSGAWMATRTVPGWSAVDPRWRDDPRAAVIGVGEGLRALHDSLPVPSCPFTWSTDERLDRARAAGRNVDAIGPQPATDQLVVCHGDACAPNTLLGADGRWVGHVDLGALGVADRWADLAVASMSLGWNHGPGWDDLFHEAYGLPQDPERTAWYRALWELDVDDVDDPRRAA